VVRGSGNIYGFRQGKWKVVQNEASKSSGSGESDWELYNLEEDPSESKNLILEQPKMAEQLLKLLSDHLKSTE